MHHQRAGEANALAHAAGQFLRIGAFEPAEANQVDRLFGAAFAFAAVDTAGFQAELHVFLHGQPGKQREALKHHRDAFRWAKDGPITPEDLARGRGQQAGDNAPQRRLAGPGTAEQRNHLAFAQCQVDVIQDDKIGTRVLVVGLFAVPVETSSSVCWATTVSIGGSPSTQLAGVVSNTLA